MLSQCYFETKNTSVLCNQPSCQGYSRLGPAGHKQQDPWEYLEIAFKRSVPLQTLNQQCQPPNGLHPFMIHKGRYATLFDHRDKQAKQIH